MNSLALLVTEREIAHHRGRKQDRALASSSVVFEEPSVSDVNEAAPLSGLLNVAGGLLRMRDADVGRNREDARRRRFVRLALGIWTLLALILWRGALKSPDSPWVPFPHIDPLYAMLFAFFGLMMLLAVGQQMMTGKSPHVVYRADQIETTLADVVGIDPVKDEVVRSLNLFLSHDAYSSHMGGTPRRGLLFEGPPGTGKTHLARAMAHEAGVPFLFVSGTSFQTVWQGQSSKKIRQYFKALRKAALKEGGAIGFIEEIDVIAQSRSGVATAMAPLAVSGCSGTTCLPATYAAPATITSSFTAGGDTSAIINELLVQMQSFSALTGWQRLQGWFVDRLNLLMPVSRQIKRPTAAVPNVLLIAATNRASSLDPALLRPGRFDRRLSFELPVKSGRRQLIDHFLGKKSHVEELDSDDLRDALAATTIGYSPVMIENLFDEALVNAVKHGRDRMTYQDVAEARLAIDVGTGHPVEYTAHEQRLIATHEAGHATMAYLAAPHRRLEILTIIKRKGALGMLAHGDREDVYTRSRTEMEALIQIAFGGQCAEEIFFNDVSTGPAGDLLFATNCAAEMIGQNGMDENLVSFLAIQNSGFADTNIVGRVLGDDQGRQAVQALLERHKAVAKQTLLANTHLVEALRDALLEHDELIGHEITDVLDAAAAQGRVIDLSSGPSEVRST
ncbi:MAG: ATPase central domain protein [Frankiales bacterium]|nr:ATPase central domain protein [Frankiales bacterium]